MHLRRALPDCHAMHGRTHEKEQMGKYMDPRVPGSLFSSTKCRPFLCRSTVSCIEIAPNLVSVLYYIWPHFPVHFFSSRLNSEVLLDDWIGPVILPCAMWQALAGPPVNLLFLPWLPVNLLIAVLWTLNQAMHHHLFGDMSRLLWRERRGERHKKPPNSIVIKSHEHNETCNDELTMLWFHLVTHLAMKLWKKLMLQHVYHIVQRNYALREIISFYDMSILVIVCWNNALRLA